MTDSARHCATCNGWGNHHTDRHEGQSIQLLPREIADLIAISNIHAKDKVELDWQPGAQVFLKVPAPQWALDLLKKWRSNKPGPTTIKCPTCNALPGHWCFMGSTEKRNFIHDKRTFRHWEQENGRKING